MNSVLCQSSVAGGRVAAQKRAVRGPRSPAGDGKAFFGGVKPLQVARKAPGVTSQSRKGVQVFARAAKEVQVGNSKDIRDAVRLCSVLH